MKASFALPLARLVCLGIVLMDYCNASAQLPPLRSTVFDGSASAQVRFPANIYAPSNTMTLEAWVHREDAGRCETILAQNFTSSFWFGFCSERLRFYRQGGSPIDATRNVPAHRWTHVAVVFDPTVPAPGNTVTFYIDGTAAGGANTRPSTAPLSLPLYLGSSPGSLFSLYPFRGALDEVRIWSVARTPEQIRTNRFRELVAEPGLVAAFPGGGNRELISGRTAEQTTGTVPEVAGILPRDLVVPRQRTPVTFDGIVNDAAYAGAEALVLRYVHGTNEYDLTARLVFAPTPGSFVEHLYLAIPQVGSATSSTLLSATPAWRAYVDRTPGDATAPGPDDFRFSYDAYDTRATASSTGNASGGFTGTNAAPGRFEARSQTGIEFDAPSAELRFSSGTVIPGPLGSPDRRFMVDLHDPFRSLILPGFTRSSPFDAIGSDTTTWPTIRLGATIGSVAAIRLNVKVLDPDRGSIPLAGAGVSLFNAANGTLIARGTTATPGILLFTPDVPTNTPVRLQLELPSGWRYADPPQVAAGGLAALGVTLGTVDFPGCPNSRCDYPDVTFTALPPPAEGVAAALTGVEPTTATSAILLRDSPTQVLPAGTVTATGTNLDRGLRLWTALASGSCGTPPGPGDPEPRDNFPACNWQPIEPLTRSATSLSFQLPYTNSVGREIRVWLYNSWSGRWLTATPATVRLTEPPYPMVHGFSFANYGDGHDIDDYRAAFPGVVCDPFKMVGFWAFFPIYLDILDGEGECVGMVTTSHFLRTTLNPASLTRGVFDAAGFTTADNALATFDAGNICAPRPTSLRAVIRSNHGTQTSSQFLGETLSQLQFGISGGFGAGAEEFGGRGFTFYTPMADRLAQIRPAPLSRVICIKPDLLGSGHALLPLAIRATADPQLQEIDVYDPNHPGETRVLRVHTGFDRFSYNGFAEPWKGAFLFVHDIPRFWTGGRDIISIDTLGTAIDRLGVRGLLELLGMLVSGDAEPQLTFPDGTGWGWRGDRTPIQTATNVIEVPNFGQLLKPQGRLGHGPAQAFLNPNQALPGVELHARGDHYRFQASQGGNLFQLFATGRKEGDRDQIRFLDKTDLLKAATPGSAVLPASEPLQGFLIRPGRSAAGLEPRIALGRGASNTLALFSWSGLDALPAGASLRFGIDAARDGVLLVNDSALPITPSLSLLTPPASGTTPVSNHITLPALPAGAALGSYLLTTQPGAPVRLQLEIDLDRDRKPETQWIFSSDTPPDPKAPALRAEWKGDRLFLRWTATNSPWILEYARAVEGPWLVHPGPLELEGSEVQVTETILPGSARFFRLSLSTKP